MALSLSPLTVILLYILFGAATVWMISYPHRRDGKPLVPWWAWLMAGLVWPVAILTIGFLSIDHARKGLAKDVVRLSHDERVMTLIVVGREMRRHRRLEDRASAQNNWPEAERFQRIAILYEQIYKKLGGA